MIIAIRRLFRAFLAALIVALAAPISANAQSERLMDLYNNYMMYLEAGNYLLARDFAERTFELAQNELGHDKAMIADRTVDLAAVEVMLGELNEAIKHYEDAIDLYEAALGPDTEHIVRPLQALADAEADALLIGAADETYLRAIDLLQRYVGESHLNTAIALWNYAEFLLLKDASGEDALAVIARAENIIQQAENVPLEAQVQFYTTMGSIQIMAGLDYEAVESLDRAAALPATPGDAISPATMSNLYLKMAEANGRVGRDSLARSYFFEAKPGEPAVILINRPRLEMPTTTVPEIGYNMRGQVIVEFSITREGDTRGIKVISSLPDSSFGVAARRNVVRWDYLPPMDEEGRNVEISRVQEFILFYRPPPPGPREAGSVND